MSEETPAEEAPKEPAESPSPEPASAEKDPPPPSDRDQAVHDLRGQASDLLNVQFSKIVSEAAGRLRGVTNVNIFHEVHADGDFLAGPGSRSTARRSGRSRAQPQDLAAIEYFAPPPDFQDCVDRLRDTNLLIIADAASTGRFSRALAALREVVDEDAVIYRLPTSILGNPSWRIPRPRSGCLVVDPDNGDGKFSASKLTDDWLAKTAERLQDEGSHLVVVTGPAAGSLATATKRVEFVVEELELPDPMDIVRKRLDGEIPWADPETLRDQLAAAGVEELLEERDNPEFAARVARAVVAAVRAGEDLGKALDKLRDPTGQVREWLSQNPGSVDVALVFATAVLENASYLHVADAAIALHRQLSNGSSATLTLRYLRKIVAERSWLELDSDEAGGSASLRFKSVRLRVAVLRILWLELDGAREKILTWLKNLADHTNVDVRARAAHAAGILANTDFEHGVHGYLLHWATSESPLLQQSAAYGLNVAGTQSPGNAGIAWSYVERWAELVGEPKIRRLPITAGLAVGGQLGTENPRRALRVLRRLVRFGDWGLLESVAVSTQALLESGCAGEVLQALLEWTERSEDGESEVKALTMFAFAVEPEAGRGERPLLMREESRHREVLSELWGRALANSAARGLAEDALRSWVRICDRDRSTAEPVLSVLAGIADRGTSDFERILHLLRGWASDPHDPSDQAAEFHDTLLDLEEEAS
ncbi:hypothetical protein CU254_00310 [Amycolatopsis sp. AA4]|uniref:hypothetical protein n=1 Tax=Actinomycetes TaxID=1760 RepID=UPI0001B554D8|nr:MULTISPECIES: hypothetical protein [Actinomycetes]ATY09100.1 hypothetical protein CU254_00310 [Amycolatopsis sp. AA4]EFL04386.1 predicted protein [Streptomyces sp. AA4]